ncbi:DUF1178 family protein [Sphingomonas sp. Mn802worker]|uniref:DUF1178 family protein n=1 Tax=Sphingomonas sp. Mn802worker TaxID=629773 RepID=UPI00036510A1|nr:DUF1178 family protein [Sphingomonas sp. Mn802worker]
MIVFDLRCPGDHVFEVWFASSAAFEEQRARGLVSCPTCGSGQIEKAVMAPRVGAKGNSVAAAARPDLKTVLNAIATEQAAALRNSNWVGKDFATEARAIHDGEKPDRLIHGQATAAEARALIDDGVPVAPLLVPVTPPESLN